MDRLNLSGKGFDELTQEIDAIEAELGEGDRSERTGSGAQKAEQGESDAVPKSSETMGGERNAEDEDEEAEEEDVDAGSGGAGKAFVDKIVLPRVHETIANPVHVVCV